MNLNEQVKASGKDIQPIDEQGMGLVLKRLESARKLGAGYAQGMASEWMQFLADECAEKHRQVPTLGTVLKAASRLANNPQIDFAAPSNLWAEVWKLARENVSAALGNRPLVIPDAVCGEPKAELEYRRLFNQAATATGNGVQAREWALRQMGLSDRKPALTPMPDNLKQKFKNLPKGLRK